MSTLDHHKEPSPPAAHPCPPQPHQQGEEAKRLAELQAELDALRLENAALAAKTSHVTDQIRHLVGLKTTWLERANSAESNLVVTYEEARSIEVKKRRCSTLLDAMMAISVANDCFYIWHWGPFATMNGLKLGRLPAFYPVEWSDINAALGQAAVLLCTVTEKAGFTFKQYRLHPMGSFTKLVKVDDPTTKLNLYYDDNFTFFPKRNFNTALQSFLKCVEEFGQYVEERDPTLRLPYRVQDGKIQDIPITLTPGSEEQWTRALKYLMTNLKWLVAWTSKHCTGKMMIL